MNELGKKKTTQMRSEDMTKKLIDILDKYKNENWCPDIASNIDNNIHNIIKKLKDAKENLSQKLYEINLSDELQEDNIINNIQNDIKTVKQLMIYFTEMRENLFHITKLKTNQMMFDSRLNIFVIDDDLCPICNVKLFPLCVDYHKIIDDVIFYNVFENGYECPCCKKKFAMQHDINDIDFIHANITFDYQYLKHENELTIN